MSWVITGSEKTPVDPQFGSVSLLLHGNADGSGNILDSSPSPKTITKFGNAASTIPPSYPNGNSAFGNALSFDGNGDYLQSASADFGFGLQDFTIEIWFYINTLQSPNNRLIFFSDNKSNIDLSGSGINSGKIVYYDGTSYPTSGSALALGQWHHVAVTRSATNGRIFINGQQLASFTSSFNYGTTSRQLFIGATNSGVESFNGYIDDLRITKGVARYTSNFTPPTAPFPDI